MAKHLRRLAAAAVFLATVVTILTVLPRVLNPTPPDEYERKRDKQWVDSSPYWIDRQACRWLGLCGIQHLRWDAPALSGNGSGPSGDLRFELLKAAALAFSAGRTFVTKEGVSSWEVAPMTSDLKNRRMGIQEEGGDRILDEVPDYVLAHAPLVHLSSEENFWPSDMAEHVRHLEPYVGGELVNFSIPSLANIGKLNAQDGIVFLQSEDDVESRPVWLHNRVGIPVPFGDDDFEEDKGDGQHGDDGTPRKPGSGRTWWDADKKHPPQRVVDPTKRPERQRRPHQSLKRRITDEPQRPLIDKLEEDAKAEGHPPSPGGYSKGPAVLILVDKGSGIVDAFWFFFYSYNLGQTVLNIRFGNHVGDWEHCMIRFEHGVPRAMFLSEHAGGKAYAWKALEKKKMKGSDAERPVIYSAVGSHAMYALPGMHPYVLPFKMLKDITDKGPLWDPARNHYAFWYDYELEEEESSNPPEQERTSLAPAISNPDLPTSWFHFEGYWGDDVYPLSDRRQWRLFGEYHYIDGPLGPKFKFLERRKVCQTEKCIIVESIEAGEKSAWY